MPRITDLKPVKGSPDRFLVTFDGHEPQRVSARSCARHRLAAGRDLSELEMSHLVSEARAEEAMDAALRYLSHRPRTRRELVRHLQRRGLGEHADDVVAHCQRLRYVDDAAYARSFARDRIRLRPRGTSRLVSELLARGVDGDTARRTVEQVLSEEGVSETDLLWTAARHRLRALGRMDRTTARRRLTAYLRRRGFGGASVRRAVDELLPGSGDGART